MATVYSSSFFNRCISNKNFCSCLESTNTGNLKLRFCFDFVRSKMGFRLRGGTPKNMGQGIYWVQRNLADQRAAAARQKCIRKAEEADQKRAQKALDIAKRFDKRCLYIQVTTKEYFDVADDKVFAVLNRRKILNQMNNADRFESCGTNHGPQPCVLA